MQHLLTNYYETHTLKTWPEFYKGIVSGVKTFELRKNDRNFQVGDVVKLDEWDPKKKDYTGRWTERNITDILTGPAFGLQEDYVILSLASVENNELVAYQANADEEWQFKVA